MADGKITIETSIDNAGALRDLNKLINQVNTKGKEAAGRTASCFSAIGKAAGIGVKAATASIGAMSGAISAAGGFAIKTGIDFETAFAGVKKTVDAPKEVIDSLRESLINMSKEMPQSASELAGIAEAAGQLGIETENIESFTKTMAQLGDATNMMATEAADSLARFANITGMSQADFDRLGSTIVALGNNLATTESEITEMSMRLAGAGHQVGMSESQIMSFAAALSSVGINAEAGGSAFSSVMAKMQLATEKGGEELQNFADVAGMSADEFKAAFEQDAASAIISFIDGLSKCESQGKSAIGVLDSMGITEIMQRDALLRAAGASDVFTKALKIGTEAWDENTALANEASQRYETLESKLDMMKNNAAALGIQFKDSIDGKLREAVDAGTESINRLSDAFTNGGIDAAVAEAGDIIADLSVRIAGAAPDMIQSASTLLQSFVKGISSHKGEIINAGIEIVRSLADGIADMLPSSIGKPAKEAVDIFAKSLKSGGLKEAAGDVVNIFKDMASLASSALKPAAKAVDLLTDSSKLLTPAVTAAYTAVKVHAAMQALSNKEGKLGAVITAAKTAATKLSTTATALHAKTTTIAAVAQEGFNAAVNAFGGPVGLAVTAIASLLAAVGMYSLTAMDSSEAVREETDALAENAEQIRETQQARQESIDGINREYGHYQQLWDELQQNVDANGKVKAGYEDRAAFITSALSDALGTEITMTDGVIDKYSELQQSISDTIEKKRQQAVLDAYQDSYTEAVKKQADANKDLASTYADLVEAKKNAKSAEDELKEAHVTSGYLYDQLKGKVDSANAKLKDAQTAYGNAKTAADEYNNTIENYEAASGAVINGSESASSALLILTNNMKTAGTATEEELAQQVETYRTEFENMRAAVGEGGTQIEQQMVSDAQQAYLLAAEQHMIGQGMTQEQVAAGLEQLRQQIGASGIPETAGAEATKATDSMSAGFASGTPAVQAGVTEAVEGAKSTLQNSDIPGTGAEAVSGTGDAMGTSLSSQSAPVSAGAATLASSAKGGLSSAGLGTIFRTTAQTAGTVFSGALQGQSGSAGKASSTLAQTAVKTLTAANLPNQMLTNGKQSGQSLADGLKSQSGLVSSAADVLVTSARNGVGQLGAEGRNAGQQFSAGLAQGISSGAGGVASAAAEVARKAAEAARANLDINSPSGVMEDVGYWYDSGLEKGIRRNADGVLEAVDGLTDILIMNPRDISRTVQGAFDANISRITERYTSAQDRISSESSAEIDYNRIAVLFADRLVERLGTLKIKVFERDFARLVREVMDGVF